MSDYNIVLQPQQGAQSLALSCPCNEVLFEGTRGSSKTATQLMRFRRLVGLGYGSFWRGAIFDIEYKNLSDIISQSKRFFNKFNDGARFLSSPSDLKWVWPTGEELMFRYEKNAEGYWNYHGAELPFLGHNELTKRADDEFYLAMFSCMRSSFRPEDYPRPDGTLLPPIPLECFSTTNPFGVGHNWVKKRFIDPAPRGRIQREHMMVDTGEGEPEKIELTRVAIHGSWKENKYLDKLYIAFLMAIKDPNKRKAWLEGDWSVTTGGRFDYLWDESIHVLKPFDIPPQWKVDRSHDWGESKPFSNLWFAESDGTPVNINGQLKHFPKGCLFLIGEWYGCEKDEVNKGLNMSATKVAQTVKKIDESLYKGTVIEGSVRGQLNIIPSIVNREVKAGVADSAIYTKNDEQISIADKMESQGIKWLPVDKRPGSRINGASIICEMLEAAIDGKLSQSGVPERPAVYVFDNCRGFISRFPTLSRDSKNPDDIDTDQEDHDYDAFRYRCSSTRRELFSVPIRM